MKEKKTGKLNKKLMRAVSAVLAIAMFAVTSAGALLSLSEAVALPDAREKDSVSDVTAKETRIDYVGPKTSLTLDASPSAEELVVYVLDEKGKQVEGCAFQAVVTSAGDGSTVLSADTDKDGVITVKDPKPGEYQVELLRYGGFASPDALSVTVDEPVAHVKVDVSDRIRNQNDIDVSRDDSRYGDDRREASEVPDDTVEWVDPTMEEIGTEIIKVPVTDANGHQLYGSTPRLSQLYESGNRYLYNADGSESWVKATVDSNGHLINAYQKDDNGDYVECTYSVMDQYGYPVCGKDGKPLYIFDDVSPLMADEEQTVYRYTGWQTIKGKVYYFDRNGEKVTGLQVIGGLTYYFDQNGVRSSVLGIDVSTWNENINWNKVKDAGVEFVIVRVGFRGYGSGSLVEDSSFRSHMNGAKDAGLRVGVYFFTQAVSEKEAVEEASMCLQKCAGYSLDYPIFIDMEDAGSSSARTNRLSNAQRTAIVKAFCDTIRAGGYRAGLYANKYYLESKINVSQLSSDTVIWLAHYTSKQTDYHGRFDMWQYSDTGSISGIPGYVDLNIGYLGY